MQLKFKSLAFSLWILSNFVFFFNKAKTILKVFKSCDELNKIPNLVATIGSFDGVHLGHNVILKELIKQAKRLHGKSLVISFHPHPRLVLDVEARSLRFLTSIDEKIELLTKAKIDYLLLLPFTSELSEISSNDFIQNILLGKLHLLHLVIGFNHNFGKKESRSINDLPFLLKKNKLEFTLIGNKTINDISVSSTLIRKALAEGDISTANKLLGYSFSISGVIVHGNRIGRTIGFPTANIMRSDVLKALPADGVYAVKIKRVAGVYLGMLNIGNNPTVDGTNHSIEVHIFNFNDDIYGEEISVEFVKKIRNERKFASVELLKEQLTLDRLQAQDLLVSN